MNDEAVYRVGSRSFVSLSEAIHHAGKSIRCGSKVYNSLTGGFEVPPPVTITVPYPPADFGVVEYCMDGETFDNMQDAVNRWFEVGSNSDTLDAIDTDGDVMYLSTPNSPDGWED